MPEQRVSLVVEAVDKASATLRSIGSSLKDFAEKNKEAVDASKAFAVGVAGAGAAIATFGVLAVKAAADQQSADAQLAAVLKSTHGAAGLFIEDLKDQASALQKLTTYSDDAVESAQALLLTFTNVKGPVFQGAIDTILDMSTALGQDLKSSAIQLGKALNDPINGISALQRVGVSFNDQQQEQIKTLVESGKVMEAQKLILKELNTEFGGSATAAANTFNGQMARLKNQLGETMEVIGFKLLPYLTKFADMAMHFAEDVLPVWIDKAQEILKWLKDHPAVIYAVSGAIIGGLVPAVYAAAVAFASAAIALAPFLIGGAIIGALVAGIVWIVKNWDMISEKAHEIWEGIAAFFESVFTRIRDFFVSVWNGIKDFYIGIWTAIVDAVKLYLDFVVGIIATVLDFLVPDWEQRVGELLRIWTEKWEAIKSFVLEVFNAIKSFVQSSLETLKTVITTKLNEVKGLWSGLWGDFKNILFAVWDAIRDKVMSVVDFINAQVQRIQSMIAAVSNAASSVGGGISSFVSGAVNRGQQVLGFATGGTVPGPLGAPMLAMVHGGEQVIPASGLRGAGGGSNIFVTITGNNIASDLDMRDLAQRVGDEIMNSLRLNLKV